MKRPLSIIIISKHPTTSQEIHTRFDVQTSYPRFSLLSILLKALFKTEL